MYILKRDLTFELATKGEKRMVRNIGCAILSGLMVLSMCAHAQQSEAPQLPKRYPWDKRPPKCFISAEPSQSWTCRTAGNWPNFAESKRHVDMLYVEPDPDLIDRAATEVGFSEQQFPNGRYLFEAWIMSAEANFQYDLQHQTRIVADWEAAKGNDGFVSVAKAHVQVGQAWQARGNGFSKTVGPEAWNLYYKKLEAANAILDSASPHIKNSGPWYYLKIQIAYQHPKLRPAAEKLLNDAISKWPDCASFYSIPMQFASPKWGGSFEQMDAVARLAMEKSKTKWGAAYYSLLYVQGFEENPQYTLPDGKGDWSLMKKGFRDLESHQGMNPAIWKAFAGLSCQMRDREEARRLYDLFDSVGGEEPADKESDACRQFAYASNTSGR
jgi:hypothetical protein